MNNILRAPIPEASVEEHPNRYRRMLQQVGNFAVNSIAKENPVLAAMAEGKLSQDQMKKFILQRHLAAVPFERLLQRAIQGAREEHDDDVAEVLEQNLKDERGVGSYGVYDPGLSHASWREDFSAALGLHPQDLEEAAPEPGTIEYLNAIEELIAEGDYVKMAGAIYALERSIPAEFHRILAGVEKVFPQEFRFSQEWTPEELVAGVRGRVERARRYLVDHIHHDAASHAPDLEEALTDHMSAYALFHAIHGGIDTIIAAKKKFYQGIEYEPE